MRIAVLGGGFQPRDEADVLALEIEAQQAAGRLGADRLTGEDRRDRVGPGCGGAAREALAFGHVDLIA
jgi:hypothetical protein